jgi:haloacid dehalogenase superfamily, subfamily IA, variant 3 with third motif having DD or ED
MGISIPGRVIVFDYGEVISQAPDAANRGALLQLAGVDAGGPAEAAFWQAYDRHRGALDEGTLGIADYWRGMARELGAHWDAATVHRLWVTDFRSWLSIDPDTLDVLVDLAEGGTRLALLSNAGRDFGSYFRHGSLGGLFEAVFVSGELGMIKPSAEIFELAMRQLGITSGQTVFIDNKEINVRGAETLGITGHVFTGAESLRAFLTELSTTDPRLSESST